MSSDCISTENKYSAGADVAVETALVLLILAHVLIVVIPPCAHVLILVLSLVLEA